MLADTMQARLAKERESRETRAATRREKMEAEQRREQEREAKETLELLAEMKRRHEAGLSAHHTAQRCPCKRASPETESIEKKYTERIYTVRRD